MAPRRRTYFDDYFPQSRPREAQGGVKAKSQRGAFGASWWAKRWIAVLESFRIGARLGRGRSYARSGQVLGIEVAKGVVSAKVQGSRARPYEVTVRVKALSASDWKKLGRVLSREPLFAAKLLAGEMPQDIERAFAEAGLSLFPHRAGDLKTDCSCPDWSNPCKHVAAVYYLLGEEFDRDPFLIFRLRGLERDALARLLGGPPPKRERAEEPTPGGPEELPSDYDAFWKGRPVDEAVFPAAAAADATAALLRRLGPLPFWRGQVSLVDVLAPVYQAAAPQGLEIVGGRFQPAPDEAAPRSTRQRR